MTTRQLALLVVAVVALTLSLAWLIERRQVLSLRQELDHWGGGPSMPAPEAPGPPPDLGKPGSDIQVGWPEDEEL